MRVSKDYYAVDGKRVTEELGQARIQLKGYTEARKAGSK